MSSDPSYPDRLANLHASDPPFLQDGVSQTPSTDSVTPSQELMLSYLHANADKSPEGTAHLYYKDNPAVYDTLISRGAEWLDKVQREYDVNLQSGHSLSFSYPYMVTYAITCFALEIKAAHQSQDNGGVEVTDAIGAIFSANFPQVAEEQTKEGYGLQLIQACCDAVEYIDWATQGRYSARQYEFPNYLHGVFNVGQADTKT